MHGFLTEPAEYLYHYTRAEVAADHIIPDMRLRFGPISNLNDPRDARARLFSIRSGANTPEYDHDYEHARLNSEIVRPCVIASFTVDSPAAIMVRRPDGSEPNPILALHERGFARPRMWSQYADNHTGICLVLRRNTLENAVTEAARATAATVVQGPVTYQNASLPSLGPKDPFAISIDHFNQQGFSRAADRHFDLHWRGLFFEKNTDWESEREYRILVRNQDRSDAALFVPIESALAGVVYGEKIARGHLAKIAGNLLDTDIQLAEARWQNGIPQIMPDHPRPLLQRMASCDLECSKWSTFLRFFSQNLKRPT